MSDALGFFCLKDSVLELTPTSTSRLSTFEVLAALALASFWFIAFEDVVSGGLFSVHQDIGYGFYPVSFAMFTLVFVGLGVRRAALSSEPLASTVAAFSTVMTAILASVTAMRGLQVYGLGELAVLDRYLGELGSESYTSFFTLLGILLVHGFDAHWGKASSRFGAWVSYIVLIVLGAALVHQVSDVMGGPPS